MVRPSRAEALGGLMACRRGDVAGGPLVRFSNLPFPALQRYARHYGLDAGEGEEGLIQRIEEHFAHTVVNEHEALSAFVNANARSRGMRTPEETPRRPASRDMTPRKRKAQVTYSDMISQALKQLPSHQGTLEEICDVIEMQFARYLNHELESGPRRVPVWKASVRKIINLNYGRRFQRLNTIGNTAMGANKAVFCLAPRTQR